jgi:hypothetical protein
VWPMTWADSVSAALKRQGLIWNDPPGFGAWGITDYGWRILNLPRKANVAPWRAK